MAAPAICRPGFQSPSSILPLQRKSLAGREGSRSSKNISVGKCSEGTSRKSAARDLNPASGGRRMRYRRSLSGHGRRSVAVAGSPHTPTLRRFGGTDRPAGSGAPGSTIPVRCAARWTRSADCAGRSGRMADCHGGRQEFAAAPKVCCGYLFHHTDFR